MTQANISVSVRNVQTTTCIFDIKGEINAYAEDELMKPYAQVTEDGADNIILNFTDLEYMNSSGIGLLVTLLIRVQRQGQQLLAYGLSDHYRQIFELTRLNEAITIYESEDEAVQAASVN